MRRDLGKAGKVPAALWGTFGLQQSPSRGPVVDLGGQGLGTGDPQGLQARNVALLVRAGLRLRLALYPVR